MWLRALALLLILLVSGCLKPMLPTGSTRLGTEVSSAGSLELYRVPLRVTLGGRRTQMLPLSWDKAQLTVEGSPLKAAQSYLYDPGAPNVTTLALPSDAFRLPLNATLTLTVELQTAGGGSVASGTTTFTTPSAPGLASATVTVFPLTIVLTGVHPAIARPGQTVTIEGHFPNPNTAAYGVGLPGGPATITQVSSHSLQVTVPGNGTGPVTVTYGGDSLNGPRFRAPTYTLGLQPFAAHADQTSTLRPMVELAIPRSEYTLTVVGANVYAIGGVDDLGTRLSSVERAPLHEDGTLGRFEVVAGVGLSSPRSEHATLRVGNRLYVIGGNGGSGPLPSGSSVESITLDAQGNLVGNFSPVTGGLATPRFGAGCVVIGPYVYVLGGNGGGNSLNSVERAMINADGSLGPFSTLAGITLTAGRHSPACVVSGDNLYVIGGWDNGTLLDSIDRAAITPEGTLDVGTVSNAFESASQPVLAEARYAATAVVIGDQLCVLGGQNGSGYSASIESINLHTDGSLGSIFSLQPYTLTQARRAPCSVQVGNSLYVVGGFVGGTASRTAEVATLNATGGLSAFSATGQPALQTARFGHAVSVAGHFLHVTGGVGGSDLASVEQAQINDDGTLAAFTTSGVPTLQFARSLHSSVVIGHNLYVIGGRTGSNATSSIECAPLNADGSLAGPFSTTGQPTLATPRFGHATFVLGNYLYVLGGHGAATLSTMERASINADGSLGTFVTTGPGIFGLATAREGFGVAVLQNTLYAIGGVGGLSSLEQAPLNADGTLAGGFTIVSGVSLPQGREAFAVARTGNYLSLLGGYTTAAQGNVLQLMFDATGVFSSPVYDLGSLLTPRRDHAAVTLGNYMYLIGGKDSSGTAMNSVECATLQ